MTSLQAAIFISQHAIKITLRGLETFLKITFIYSLLLFFFFILFFLYYVVRLLLWQAETIFKTVCCMKVNLQRLHSCSSRYTITGSVPLFLCHSCNIIMRYCSCKDELFSKDLSCLCVQGHHDISDLSERS